MKTTMLLAASLCALALGATPAPAQTPSPDRDPSETDPAETTPPEQERDTTPGDPEPATHGHEVLVIEGTAPIDAAGARAHVSARDIQNTNVVDVEDALKYLPNVHVRKRYVGDANGVMQIRGISTWQTARTDVTADGMPLSYHLQTRYSGAPRWSLIAPEEVERIDVSYGPYAASQSGHAMAGTVAIETRMPAAREEHAQLSTFGQSYRHYGVDDEFMGYKAYVSHGDRAGALRYFAAYTHLDNEGQPQSYGAVSGPFDQPAGEPAVTGAYSDLDPRGLDRVIYGHRGPERVQQHLAKLKLAYELGPRADARASVALLDRSIRRGEGENYLRDPSGATVWACPCDFDGRSFTIRGGDFAASERRQTDILAALRVRAEPAPGWRLEADGSYYQVLRDRELAADRSSADPADTGSGVVTDFHGTRWTTAGVKLAGDRFLFDGVSVETGYQLARYSLGLTQHAAGDIASGHEGALRNASGGDTELHALYAQARWKRGRFDLTPGVRQELWRAFDGYYDDGSMDTDTDHESRTLWRTSPKLVAGYEPTAGTRIQGGVALAYRFPIVEELFRNQYSQVSTDLADASLAPERGFHKTVSLERRFGAGRAALHLYEDDVRDVIFSQRDMDTGVSTFLNMDRVRTRGVELIGSKRGGPMLGALDLDLSVALQDARILENQANPTVEGNRFPRVPRLRASAHGTYHLTRSWDLSLGGRYSSNQYDRLENDDSGTGYGAIDAFLVMDARSSYRFDGLGLALSVGVDNLLGERYFVFHPYAQRMFYTDLRWSY